MLPSSDGKRYSKQHQSTFQEILERLSSEHERQCLTLQMEISELRTQLNRRDPDSTTQRKDPSRQTLAEAQGKNAFITANDHEHWLDTHPMHVADVMQEWGHEKRLTTVTLDNTDPEEIGVVMPERADDGEENNDGLPCKDGPPPASLNQTGKASLMLDAPSTWQCGDRRNLGSNISKVSGVVDRHWTMDRDAMVPMMSCGIIGSQHAFRTEELRCRTKFVEAAKISDRMGMLESCFRTWWLLTRHMQAHFAFQVLEPWKVGRGKPAGLALHRHVQEACHDEADATAQEEALAEEEHHPREGWGRLIMAPNATKRTWWDLVGTCFLLYDIVGIPLDAFEPAPNGFTSFMDYTTLTFWTLDILMSCITGYVHRGVTVMDPWLILRNYLRTLFLMDLVVVGPDWIFLIAMSGSDEDSNGPGSGSNRLVRIMRVARLARLLRLVKLARGLAMLRDRIESEVMFIVANILKLIVMLLVVNHFLGSFWYFVGNLGFSNGLRNWIEEHGFAESSLGYRYFTSLHWSLTQFTPASMSVQPHNIYERMFAICCLVFGLVLFSSFISSITASMTQLRNMQEDQSKQFWLLRRYLRQRGIDKQLNFRILRYVEYAIKEKTVLVSEAKVWSLALLSQQLREELQYEVSFKCLVSHPFFERARAISSISTFKLAEQALSVQMLASKDTLFNPGTEAKKMFIVGSGQLRYLKMDELYLDDDESQKIYKDDWACEQALWTTWTHLGCLRAVSEVRLVAIAGKAFEEVMKMDPVAWDLAHNYAQKYVEWLNETPRGALSDVSHQVPVATHVRSFLTPHGKVRKLSSLSTNVRAQMLEQEQVDEGKPPASA